MTKTKFVIATGTEKFPVVGCITSALKQQERLKRGEISLSDIHTELSISPSRLEDVALSIIKKIKNNMAAEESDLGDLKEKIRIDEESTDELKEMFWGKDWKVYSEKLRNRLTNYDKVMNSYAHLITIVEDNMNTDDLNVACDIVELYIKIVERVVGENSFHKIAVGDKVIYKLPDIPSVYNGSRSSLNSIVGRHIVLERFDQDAWES